MCSALVSAHGLKNELYSCVADNYTGIVSATRPGKLSPYMHVSTFILSPYSKYSQ